MAVPLEVSGETPTTTESGIEADTSDATNPLAPAIVDGYIPLPFDIFKRSRIGDWATRWTLGGTLGNQH